MKKFAIGAVALAIVFGASFASAANYNFQTNLMVKSTGADVTALQTMLVEKGYLTMPAGVAYGYFGELTKSAVIKLQMANGITPASGYFGPLTRAKVNSMEMAGGSTTGGSSTGGSSSSLSGGAGDVSSINLVTSGTETTLAEGKEEKVLAFELEADDNSDLDITSIRLSANVGTNGSTRFGRYVDEVVVYMEDEEVGSMEASDFSRDGADHTGTISLEDAVVKKGEEVRFYIAFVANEVIETNDQDNTIDVVVERVRFEDASGAIITDDTLESEGAVVVDFEDSTENDGAKVQSNSSSPDSTILKVDDNSNSDEYHVFTFRIKSDSDSSDMLITSLPITLAIKNASTTAINTEDLINDIYVEVGGDKYDDYDTPDNDSIAAGATEDVEFVFDIDEGDLEIAGDDTVDAKVYVKFGKQDDKYAASGSTIQARVIGADINAENVNGDNIDLTGTITGKEHSISISAATINAWKWDTSGSFGSLSFTVEADDEDFVVDLSSLVYATSTANGATTSAATLARTAGDGAKGPGTSFTVISGDVDTFTITFPVGGSNGGYLDVTATSIAGQEVPSNSQYKRITRDTSNN